MAKSKVRVCFVDGDPSVCESLRLGAKKAGFESVTFANAQEFLTRFDPSKIGCLVLEMRLPGDERAGVAGNPQGSEDTRPGHLLDWPSRYSAYSPSHEKRSRRT